MSFNKYIQDVTRNYKKLLKFNVLSHRANFTSALPVWKSQGEIKRNLLGASFIKCKVFPKPSSVYFYSTAVNEENTLPKSNNTVINVPTFEFEDMEFEQPVPHSDLCDALQVCNSVEEQMNALTSTLALSEDEVEKRAKFCKAIESLIRPFFGEVKIQIFGSTVNGFGFKGCDIDMSFETFADPLKKISYLETPDVPFVSEVLCGKVTPEEISLLPRREQLLFIHTVLLEFYKETAEPIIFINAHVPLIRFYHDKCNLKCDLSCRNSVAFANSKLLCLFGKLDERVVPLMMTIRYWAKHVELIGKGLLFNTYTISMLVIHFLQTRNPPILPSAKHIISISDSLSIDDMNDKTFLKIAKSIPQSENTQSLSELLQEFFFFYLYFDFTRVICPLIGGSVPREEFFSNNPKKFRMNTICVQDPMLESHNVADLVDYKTCKKFFKELMIAYKILQDQRNCTPSSAKWGLLNLLDKPSEYASKNAGVQNLESFSVPLMENCLIPKYDNENKKLMTAQTLLYLLQHVLLFECVPLELSDILRLLKKHDEMVEKQRKILESVIQKNSEVQEVYPQVLRKIKKQEDLDNQALLKMLMLEDFQNFISNHKLILAAECKIVKNIWLGRDFVPVDSFSVDSPYSLIEREHHISVQASKQNDLNAALGKIKDFTFFFECYESSRELELIVNFRPFQRKNFNPILGIFLKEYVPKLIKNLNELC